jgi:hypothetical protein
MTKMALAKLEAATCVGRHMKFKDKFTGVRTVWGTIEEEVYIMVGDYKHMIQPPSRQEYPPASEAGDLLP